MPQVTALDHPLTGRMRGAAGGRGTSMTHAVSRFSLAALGAVALYNAPAMAQEQARAEAIQVLGGCARAYTDSPIDGEAYAQPGGITYGNGVTANLGIATTNYVTTNLFWDLGIRYWSLDRVVSLEDTLLTTAGAGTA
jgi:hypothetical protein